MHWWLLVHIRRTCRWPLAYHVRAACSNLFNGKADVPNCDALASVDSPSLIYVRLIECLFCLPFPPFWPLLSVCLVSVCLFLSFRLLRKRSPCSAPRSPLAPSLPSRALPLVLSPDRCITLQLAAKSQDKKVQNTESPELGSMLQSKRILTCTNTKNVNLSNISNSVLQWPASNSQSYISAVIDIQTPTYYTCTPACTAYPCL